MTAATFIVTAHQGETLDALIWRTLGAGAGLVEQALELNRGIADLGAVLIEGQTVTLPVVTATPVAERALVKLWD